MASYYYLISSLPDLKANGPMPMSYEDFISMCEGNVSESKFEILKNLTLNSTEGPVVKEWAVAYGNLMKELNYQRSIALGKPYLTQYDKDSVNAQIAANALGAGNPLEAEKMLLDYEFDLLDSLVGLHTFDDAYLFGYAIKLKLLERQSCFIDQKGKDEFQRLFSQVQSRVYSL